jgi:signal transduction histidine kinase
MKDNRKGSLLLISILALILNIPVFSQNQKIDTSSYHFLDTAYRTMTHEEFHENVNAFVDAYRTQKPESLFFAYGKAAFYNRNRFDNFTSEIYYDSVILVCSNTSDYYHWVEGLIKKGAFLRKQSDFNASLATLEQAVEIAETKGFIKQKNEAKKEIAILYINFGHNQKSININLELLEEFQKEKDTFNLASTYVNLSNGYYMNGAYEDSREANIKGAELFLAIGDTLYYANARHNMAVFLLNNQEYDEAKQILLDVVEIYTRFEENKNLSTALFNLGRIYGLLGDIDSAYVYMQQCIEIKELLNDRLGMASTYIEFARMETDAGKSVAEVEAILFKAIDILEDSESLILKIMTFDALSKLYEKYGMFKNALEWSNLKYEVAAEQFQNELNAEIESYKSKQELIETRHILELKNVENSSLVVSNELMNQKLMNRTKTMWLIVISSILLVFIIAVLLIESYRQKKVSKILRENNKKIKEQNEALVIATENRMKILSVIAHDLKNPIGSIQSMVDYLIEIEGKLDDSSLEVMEAMRSTSISSLSLLENLLIWARDQKGELPIHVEVIKLKELIENALQVYQSFIKTQKVNILLDISEEMVVKADRKMLNTILRNVIGNAIKFSPAGSDIIIRAYAQNTMKVIEIEDNGMGMDELDKDKILDRNTNFSLRDASGNVRTGLGLSLCQDFIERNNGQFEFISEKNKGTIVRITLPKL